MVLDGPSLLHATFRLDDFSLLRTATTLPLTGQMILPHGDHLMPIFRLEVATLIAWFGPDERAFSCTLFFSLVAMVTAGILLLRELGGNRLTLWTFAVLLCAWEGWGVLTSGYFTLDVYPQILAVGFAAATAAVRHIRTGRHGFGLAAILLSLLGCGIDLAGLWVPAATALFYLAGDGMVPSEKKRVVRRCAWMGLAAVLFLYGILCVVAFRSGGFLAQKEDLNKGSSLVVGMMSGLAGRFLDLGISVRPARLLRHGFIHWLEAVALIVAVLGLLKFRNRANEAHRRWLWPLLGALTITVGMIVAARPVSYPGLYWPPKWTLMAQGWCVASVAFVTGSWIESPSRPNSAGRWLVWGVLSAAAFQLAGGIINDRLGVPAGRLHDRRLAVSRRADLDRLRHEFAVAVACAPGHVIELPEPATDRVRKVFPGTENYPLSDLVALLPAQLGRIVVVPVVPTRTVWQRAQRQLASTPGLAALYPPDPSWRN